MAPRKPKAGRTKGSTTVRVAIITTIGTVLVALITGFFALVQNQSKNPPPPTASPTDTLEISVIPSTLPTSDAQRILFDTYHGSSLVDKFIGVGGANIPKGFIFEQANSPLTLNYLKQYDVLVISFFYYTDKARFSLIEIEAIRDYIKQGGGVLLLGQGWVWKKYNTEDPRIEDYPLNLIASGSGIQFSENFISTVNGVDYKQAPLVFHRPFMDIEHPVVNGVKIVASVGAPGTLVVNQTINSTATAIIWGNEKTFDSSLTPHPIVMAAANIEKGRIIAIGTTDFIVPFIETYPDVDYSNIYDHLILLENTLHWLARE